VSLFVQGRRIFNDSDEIYEGVNAEHDRACSRCMKTTHKLGLLA